MNKIQKSATICTLVALSVLPSSCATVIGTVSGPVTYAVASYNVCRGDKRRGDLFHKIILTSMGVLAGPIYGSICGARQDLYALKHKGYHPHYNPLFPWEDCP